MTNRKWLEPAVLATALVILILDAGGGPGWGSSAHAVLAVRLEQLGLAPLYDALASAALALPVGEPGFRLGVLGAVLGAFTLTGIVATARALVPREPAAALVAVALLALAPPFREASAFASPSILAACGATWTVAFAARFARERDPRDAFAALVGCLLVIGSAPWLGAALAIVTAIWHVRSGAKREHVAAGIGALGLAVVALWLSAIGGLPGAAGSAATVLAETGRGAAAIVVGAGLLGIGFAAATGLSHVRWLGAIVVVVAAHEVIVGTATAALLALLAIGTAIIPSAIVRAVMPAADGTKRAALAIAAGIPLVAIAFATGATLRVDDPGATPARLAADLSGTLPPGPGVIVATRHPSWLALQHEAVVAGARPDLALAPPLAAEQADAIVASTLRAQRIVGADAASFGRLDVRRAIPRSRGFQLVWNDTPAPAPVEEPARYPTRIGHEQAIWLALERARYEAASGRLDAAARAAGLAARFGAADLAILATTLPGPERPALFGFVPHDRPPGPWLFDLFGDDLAWVAGLATPTLPADAPMPRRLHAKWREIASGTAKPDDPAITAMGPAAVRATNELFAK